MSHLCFIPQAYSNNLIDHHMILDLLPLLAQAYFAGAIPVNISYGQAAILLALGLQHVDVDKVSKSLNLPANQVLALFNKLVRRLQGRLQAAQEAAAARSLPARAPVVGEVQEELSGLDEELEQGAAVRTYCQAVVYVHMLCCAGGQGADGSAAQAGGVAAVRGQGERSGVCCSQGAEREHQGGREQAPSQGVAVPEEAKKAVQTRVKARARLVLSDFYQRVGAQPVTPIFKEFHCAASLSET